MLKIVFKYQLIGWKWIFDYSNIQKVLNEVDKEMMTNFLNKYNSYDEFFFQTLKIRKILAIYLLDSLLCGFEENIQVLKRIVSEFYTDGIDTILIEEFKKMAGRSIVTDNDRLFRNRDRYSKSLNICLVKIANIFIRTFFQSEISPQSFITITKFSDTGVFLNWLFDNYLMQNRNVKAILFLIKNVPTMYLGIIWT